MPDAAALPGSGRAANNARSLPRSVVGPLGMARYTFDQDPAGWRDPTTTRTDDVPRWLIIVGLLACSALTIALVRYAIDLLGLVSIIVVVGFSIRALTDWLTDRDSISPGSFAAVFVGLFGTALVGMWLFGSGASRAAGRLEQQLPTPMLDAIAWAEAKGWGNRVLLPPPAPAARARETDVRGVPSPGRAGDVASPNRVASRATPQQGPPVADKDGAATPAPSPAPANGPYNTSTTLSVTPRQARAGAEVDLRAVVTSEPVGSPTPEGTVVFWRDTVALGSAPLRSDGPARAVARLTAVAVDAGSHNLLAEFAGNSRFRTSRSEIVQQLVTTP
jgi:hypothetical protein